jgi:hypothetical protein
LSPNSLAISSDPGEYTARITTSPRSSAPGPAASTVALPSAAQFLYQLFSLLRVSVHYCHVVSASYQPVADPAPHVPCSDNGDVHTHPPRCT